MGYFDFKDLEAFKGQRKFIARPSSTASVPQAPAAPKKPSLSKKARTAWEKAIAGYGPEGGYGKGVEAGLERGRTQAVAGGMQSLVSAGLTGTTMAAGLDKKYEEEVGAPARAQVEETRASAIANLRAGLAGAEQRGYETAEDRALRERLTGMQVGAQTGLDYAGLASRERISSRELAMQEMLAKMKMDQSRPDADGGSYADPGAGYGGVAQGAGRAAPLASAGGRGPGSQVRTDRYRPASGIYDGPTAY